MDDRGANIDVVFRNGLKDYEMLPPPEVWDNIRPVIKKKARPVILFRAAALITILVSISFLVNRLTTHSLNGYNNSLVTLNMEASYPVYAQPEVGTLNIADKKNAKISQTIITTDKNLSDNFISPESVIVQDPGSVSINMGELFQAKNAQPVKHPRVKPVTETGKTYTELLTLNPINSREVIPVKHEERWSISALASPTYYSEINAGSNALSRQLMASEQNLTSYSGGLGFSYKISKKVSIQSGIYYASMGQTLEGINSFGGFQNYANTKNDHNFDVLTSRGSVFINNSDVFLVASNNGSRIITSFTSDVFDPKKASLQPMNDNLRQNFSYLELPVMLRYKFLDKTIDLNLIGGLSYNMLVSNSVFTMVNGTKYSIGKTEGLNTGSLSSTLGMGMEYNFSEKLSLNLEPTIRYYLNPYNQTGGSDIHPYYFGIFSGVSYKF